MLDGACRPRGGHRRVTYRGDAGWAAPGIIVFRICDGLIVESREYIDHRRLARATNTVDALCALRLACAWWSLRRIDQVRRRCGAVVADLKSVPVRWWISGMVRSIGSLLRTGRHGSVLRSGFVLTATAARKASVSMARVMCGARKSSG
ncbi:DUF4916 domain-containing protein [Streptomyces rapamycinicus]|uniref:SnoaL-like domain-containing protein n=2 Tax=Streptomyces rapamycinicus TaxID=1226757 RepID=A0A3L8QWX1_STRRN|nr:DUF4916 domain-containing protein [Streptomyces rapamycinicus]MBB4787462.1 hypothetical protein [Streptomyces rapamycinicus]RLV71807.1 hypothetical protein D3C57_144810 [Streptomyces rapamycinicus NRRL 5491]UTP36822.1 DUF4916 domain-containing protein [Streptomyces rapamycinicus NRRL 5491]